MNIRDNAVSFDDVVEEVNPSPKFIRMKKELSSAKKTIEELKLNLAEDEAFYEQMLSELDVIEPLAPVPYSTPSKKVGCPTTAVLVLSDWHIGEFIDSDEVNFFNSFDWEIAQRRVSHLVRNFLDWTTAQRSAAEVDELVVCCIGDFISGDIHKELQVGNEFEVPVQNVRAGYLLSHAISELAPHFKSVRVEYVTADNHSRRTVRNQFKGGGRNSEGYVVGWIAKERLCKHSNIEFNIYAKLKTTIDVRGWRYIIEHGHTIKGWSGFPWYGADRKVAKEAKARRRLADKNFHKIIIGHYHVPMMTMDYIVNGSLSGTTEFDHGCGRHADPCQVAFMVHPKYGELNFNAFWLHHGDTQKCDDVTPLDRDGREQKYL